MSLLKSSCLVAKVFIRFTFILFNNLYVIPTFLLTMAVLHLFLRPIKPASYLKIEGILFSWMLTHVAFWMKTAGYEVVETGASVDDCVNDESIVVANHQSTGDVLTLMTFTQAKPGVASQMLWIQDVLFKLTHFGWVSMVRGDFFIQQGKKTRQLQGKLLYEHIRDIYVPRNKKWIVIFPEGGFLHKRRATSNEYARKNGYPLLENVSLPRIGAIQTLMATLSPQAIADQEKTMKIPGAKPLRWFIDVTIGYQDKWPLDLQTVICGYREPTITHLHIRKWPITDIPLNQEELTKWLYNRWQEKEQLLEHFYKTGHFPTSDVPGVESNNSNNHSKKERLVQLDLSIMFFTHIFFLLLTWSMYKTTSAIYYFIMTLLSFIV